MELIVNDVNYGNVESAYQDRVNKAWVFTMESGILVRTPFDKIKLLSSCGVYEVVTVGAKGRKNRCGKKSVGKGAGKTLRSVAKGVVTTGGGVYNIGFNDGDETQLDAYDINELENLWRDFCEENGFKVVSVDYVERV